jgi:hypothetical protein
MASMGVGHTLVTYLIRGGAVAASGETGLTSSTAAGSQAEPATAASAAAPPPPPGILRQRAGRHECLGRAHNAPRHGAGRPGVALFWLLHRRRIVAAAIAAVKPVSAAARSRRSGTLLASCDRLLLNSANGAAALCVSIEVYHTRRSASVLHALVIVVVNLLAVRAAGAAARLAPLVARARLYATAAETKHAWSSGNHHTHRIACECNRGRTTAHTAWGTSCTWRRPCSARCSPGPPRSSRGRPRNRRRTAR